MATKEDFEKVLADAVYDMCPELELMTAVTERSDGAFMTHIGRREDGYLLPGHPIYIKHLTEDELMRRARADVSYRIIAHGWTRDPFYDRKERPDTIQMRAPIFDPERAAACDYVEATR